MKKLLILLLFCALTNLVNAQNPSYSTYSAYHLPDTADYANFGVQAYHDTTLTASLVDSAGAVRLTDSTLLVDRVTYHIKTIGDVMMDEYDEWWQNDTLTNGYTLTLRRYPNYELMNIIIQPEASTSWCYYIR